MWNTKLKRKVLKLERRQKVKKCVCVEENRDKGEIKKTKGEENVAEKKMEKNGVVLVFFFFLRKGVVLVIRVVWGKGMNQFFFK